MLFPSSSIQPGRDTTPENLWEMFYKLFYYYAFSEIIIVREDVDRRCWYPVFEQGPLPLVHCCPPLLAYHRCCRLPRCSLQPPHAGCFVQTFQKQFISLFNLIHPSRVHTYFHHRAGEGSGDARRLERLPADQLVPGHSLLHGALMA